MEERLMMPAFMMKQQPLTPVSPLMPTTLPHVCEPIPPLPMTPPDADEILDAASNAAALRTALHVIATERDGLTNLGELYESNSVAQEGFMKAVNIISRTIHRGGKLVISGVGKSGKIGEKVVATMNSFAIRSAFLHPTEALHGDLGMVGPNDSFLLLTFSGRTVELSHLLSHVRPSVPLMIITSHIDPMTCPLFDHRPLSNCILLPAPIQVPETTSFGVPAPTTSTTAALALSDALAIAIARRLHPSPADIFRTYHPGGAIGESASKGGDPRIGDIAVHVASVPIAHKQGRTPGISSPSSSLTALDMLLTAARSPSGWVRLSSTAIIAPRQIQVLGSYLDHAVHALEPGIVVEKSDWISIPATSTIEEARCWIEEMRQGERGRTFLRHGTILGIVDVKGDVSGVVEIEEVVDLDDEGMSDGD